MPRLAGLVRPFGVAISLLTFPSVLIYMIGVWLIILSLRVFQHRPVWISTACLVAIWGIKNPPRTPAMIALMIAVIGVAWWIRRCGRDSENLNRYPNRRAIQIIVVLWFLWGLACWETQSTRNGGRPFQLDPARPIVCLGDSLTDGMLPDHGYPQPLGELLDVPVINLGVSGIATPMAVGQMPRVLSHRPQLVILELGGHDFLKGHGRRVCKANLKHMIRQCRDAGAEVVLMEIPRGFIVDPYFNLERQIAYEMDVQLVDDTWLRQIVLMSPVAPPGRWMPRSRLSDDGIHSNAAGSDAIARRVARAIRQMEK